MTFAEANKILVSSITPQLMEWQRLQIFKLQIEKWTGNVPQVVAGGNGGPGGNFGWILPFPQATTSSK